MERNIMASPMDFQREIRRTNPDYVVYIPKSSDGSTCDTGNEHFLVFDGPDGSLMAVWTQSSAEGEPDQRIVFARSDDEGKTWTSSRIIAGPIPPAVGNLASWGFPLVSKSGRIYVLYSKHMGIFDTFFHTTGLMAGIYSDDAGQSWSEPQIIEMPRSQYDNPDPKYPGNWIVWQKPLRLSEDKYFVGFTRWVSEAVRHSPPNQSWTSVESVVEFMRFENIDNNPEPKDIQITFFAQNEQAIRVPHPEDPKVSLVQEPSIVKLPDGNLFAAMRTSAGHPYYILSKDNGRTWSAPEPMRYQDDGQAIEHPLSPCPIYDLGDGHYLFMYHNHDGHFGPWPKIDHVRRPLWISLGEYRKNARQPIWFSPPKFFFDNEGVSLGKFGRNDISMYASFTIRHGRKTLWYPDRKFFLVGRNISEELLANMNVPQ
jgi:hypothetical protein